MSKQSWLEKVSEIRAAYRISPGNQNVAIAICSIGDDFFEIHAISGKAQRANAANLPEKPIFTTFDTPPGHSREFDAERKLLEEIASKYTQNEKLAGTIELFTELLPCDSCEYVLKQFRQMFQNIKVNIYDSKSVQLDYDNN